MPIIGNLVRSARLGATEVEVIPADFSVAPTFVQRWMGLDDDFLMPAGGGLVDTLSDLVWRPQEDTGPTVAAGDTELPPLDPVFPPLVLPVGLESKEDPDPGPIVCNPGVDAGWLTPDWSALEGVSGRDPHRFLLEPRFLDWII